MDYIEPTNRYQLNRGDSRACIDTIIQNDNAFEFDETFTGELIRVTNLDGDVPLTEADGLSLDIDETEITIEDNDGKLRTTYPTCIPLLSSLFLPFWIHRGVGNSAKVGVRIFIG